MFLSDDDLVHLHGDKIYKRAFTLNSFVQLPNIYFLIHNLKDDFNCNC